MYSGERTTHDPTLLLFCTLYYLKNIPRIHPRFPRYEQAERIGDTNGSPSSGPQLIPTPLKRTLRRTHLFLVTVKQTGGQSRSSWDAGP